VSKVCTRKTKITDTRSPAIRTLHRLFCIFHQQIQRTWYAARYVNLTYCTSVFYDTSVFYVPFYAFALVFCIKLLLTYLRVSGSDPDYKQTHSIPCGPGITPQKLAS